MKTAKMLADELVDIRRNGFEDRSSWLKDNAYEIIMALRSVQEEEIDSEGWITWSAGLKDTAKGEGRPVNGEVDYKLRSGKIVYNRPAEYIFWDTMYNESDIVAYRKAEK